MTKKFHGRTLEECLKLASMELSLETNKLNYKIVKENKGIFKKNCEIIVEFNDENEISLSELNELIVDIKEKPKINEEIVSKNRVVVDGDLIKIYSDEDKNFKIVFDNNINIYINGELASNNKEVSIKDVIKYVVETIPGKRELRIKSDSMKAYISIEYTNSNITKVYANVKDDTIFIKSKMINGDLPPKYEKEEIVKALKEKNIIYGLQEEAIEEATNKTLVRDLLIAIGKEPINDENDRIEIYFQGNKRLVDIDSKDKIDYRNLFSIDNVISGTVLAELIEGKIGTDGINIFGKNISKKLKKSLHLKVGNGCKIEGSKVIASINGQPTFKNGVFYVHEVFQAPADVDMKSGNIKFIGNVKIAKNVKEGMCVEAGSGVDVLGNVDSAKIISHGDTNIKGSVINSKIIGGADDIKKQNYINCLDDIIILVDKLIMYFYELKKKMSKINQTDGEVIKILMENKIQSLPEKAKELLEFLEESDTINISTYIKEKIIGFGPLKIANIDELKDFELELKRVVGPLKEDLVVPVDVYINYIQDSELNTTGNIYILGKGQYVSRLTCHGDIIFAQDNAVSRGGILSAKGKIKAGTVGSVAGVSTILKVEEEGVITANVAYNNTTFCFGERKYTLESPSKQVKAYMDKKGEIVVEKFVL